MDIQYVAFARSSTIIRRSITNDQWWEQRRKIVRFSNVFLLLRRSLFVKNSQILKSICRSIERQRTSRRNFTSIERKIRRKSSTRSSLLKHILTKKLQIKTFDFIEKKKKCSFSFVASSGQNFLRHIKKDSLITNWNLFFLLMPRQDIDWKVEINN